MAKYAYVRVSTASQSVDRQLDWLAQIPNLPEENIFIDKASSRNVDRPAYNQLKQIIGRGDELYVKELDRLGRLKRETKAELEWFRERGVIFRVQNIPTTMVELDGQEWVVDMINNVLIEVMLSVAENELETRAKRQAEGIASALARGVQFGRPRLEVDNDILDRHISGELTQAEASELLGVSVRTLQRRLKVYNVS